MKREPHWVKLFLRELERAGNVRIASERAGVDYTSAYQRRKRHAEFAERWEEALAAHKQFEISPPSALQAATSSRQARGGDERDAEEVPPPSGPSTIESSLDGPPPHRFAAGRSGEEMVVRPDGKLIKGNPARWSKRAEETFLTELTVSGNVRIAARAAGFSTTAVYKRRLKDRHLAAAWEAAVDTGKARVHAYLVEAATRTFDPDELPIGDEREIPKVSIREAISIARLPARDSGAGAGSLKGGKGLEGRSYDETGFDTTPISRDEWDQARENIIGRLQRLREQMEEKERATGHCSSCGQPLPAKRPDDGGGRAVAE